MPESPNYNGINPNARITILTAEEQEIAKNLSNEFYLSGGFNEIRIGRSAYRYFFLKFTGRNSVVFGLKDEIIVLLSPFEDFEPRTLDAVEIIQEKHSGFRLDKICAFVVSKDDDFVEKLSRTIRTHKECRLITPFTYTELSKSKPAEYFRKRIKTFFFERNLYDFDSPLRKDLYFFGRDELCQNLIDKHQTGQNASIFGLRRSGKTSILHSVSRRIKSQKGFVSIIDCQLIHSMGWKSALHAIVTQLNRDHNAKIEIKEEDYASDKVMFSFAHDIEKIHTRKRKKILIAFDEIEQITFDISISKGWRSGEDYVKFWHAIRSLAQKQNNPITILLSGTNPKCLEIPFVGGVDNPIYLQMKPEYIPGFTVEQTKQMVETLSSYMGITFEDDIYAYLTRDFGGHAFLIRQVCSHIKSELDKLSQRRVDRALYANAVSAFAQAIGNGFCEMVIGVLEEYYEDEHTMLTYLAIGDLDDFNELAESDPSYTRHLVGYGIICKSSNGYDFKIDAVKSYLISKNQYKKLNLSNPEKLAEISARRNKAEISLRRLIHQSLRIAYGQDKARDVVLKISRSGKSKDLSYDQLFDPNKNQIYFNDLKEIISKNWEQPFKNIFDGNINDFNSKMSLLNSIGRSDAHAKSVSEADMHTFRGTMEWLEEQIRNNS